MNLKNKIVVIIGGSQGFGAALAKCFIVEGSQVVIASKTKSRIEATASSIGAMPFVVDARKEDEVKKLAETVIKKFGAIDIWVNSAGVFKVFPKNELIDISRAHELFDINFFSTVFGSRTALLYMKEGGVIINILSSAALDATRAKNAELYASSKWAVRGYVEAFRAEVEDSGVGINVYSIYPGGMKTHLHDEALPKEFENFMDPHDVAQKVINNLKQDAPEQNLIIKRLKAEI
jgi:NAD(P)-dependent dehydrogenase (short-subunit alcohol dehydrogenase family)